MCLAIDPLHQERYVLLDVSVIEAEVDRYPMSDIICLNIHELDVSGPSSQHYLYFDSFFCLTPEKLP